MTILIVVGAVAALIRGAAAPVAVMVGALLVLTIVGVIPVELAFAGFANPATISIAGLFVVTRALRDHVPLEAAISRLLATRDPGAVGRSTGPQRGREHARTRAVLARILPLVTATSSVANNTPIVAVLAPIVRGWAERHGVPAAHLLMPVSFAAIVGGVVTTIGTGPNLVVSGMLEAAGHSPFSFFTMTPAGAIIALVGTVAIIGLAPIVLPDRRSSHERVAGLDREYALALEVRPDGPCDGVSVAAAGLRDLDTTYLASIVRGSGNITPVAPDTILQADDQLLFVGSTREVRDLLSHPGLRIGERAQVALLDDDGQGHVLMECVVGAGSSLAGSTLKDRSFRGRYGGAVIAIHRAGATLDGKLGTVRLRAGDALLVLTDRAFLDRWGGDPDFVVVVPLEPSAHSNGRGHRALAVTTFAAMIIAAASGLLPISIAVLAACAMLVATRTIGFRRALDAIDREVVLIVVAAIGIGGAISASGLAAMLAQAITEAARGLAVGGLGTALALAAVVVATMVLTELLTNVAAAALMVPIAIDTATAIGFDPTGFAVAVALGASASFLTPVGYQTNTIVYGLGGYHFSDYWRLGLPLTILTLATTLVVVPLMWT